MKTKFVCKLYLVVKVSTNIDTKVKTRDVVCVFDNHPDASVYCDELTIAAAHTDYLRPYHYLLFEVETTNMMSYENNNSTGDE